MKPFWDSLFYGLRECGLDEEGFSFKAGCEIRDDLRRIEDAIRGYDGKKALAIIEELKSQY
jgi:hypothetical protein